MANSSRIRVGNRRSQREPWFRVDCSYSGATLPQFDIVAVAAARQESAKAAALHHQVPLAFADTRELARHPKSTW
ncbi:MAG TPA: hypothetical protein VGR45_00030 [Stellaceae bacterium]|nr:hypothetical protein [Stellaceae bacterium]